VWPGCTCAATTRPSWTRCWPIRGCQDWDCAVSHRRWR
jgi:hypothetical protein